MLERPRRILYLLLYGSRVGGGEIQYEYLVKGLDRHNFQPIVAVSYTHLRAHET